MILLKENGEFPLIVNCEGYPLPVVDKLRSEGYRQVVMSEPPVVQIGLKCVDSFERVGTRYVQRWREVVDVRGVQYEIELLKKKIAESDYKVVKSMEASLMGVDLPYDMGGLHRYRQGMRDRINEYEEMIRTNG